MHRSRGAFLRRETAGVDHHQPLSDGVGAEGENHRRDAKVGDPDAIDETDTKAARDAEGNGEGVSDLAPTGCGGRHHPSNGHHPGDREVDLSEQDHQHETGGNDAEERGDLQLLQQIVRGAEADRDEQDDAEEERLPERIQIENQEQVADCPQDEGSKDRANCPPEPPKSDVPRITTEAIEFSV